MTSELDQIEQKMKNIQDSMSRMNSMVKISAQNQRRLQFITSKEQGAGSRRRHSGRSSKRGEGKPQLRWLP